MTTELLKLESKEKEENRIFKNCGTAMHNGNRKRKSI